MCHIQSGPFEKVDGEDEEFIAVVLSFRGHQVTVHHFVKTRDSGATKLFQNFVC